MEIAKKKIVAGIVLVLAIAAGLFFGGKKTTDVFNEPPSDGLYKITILESAHGSVTANKYEAKEGEEIVLTVTPDENYELTSLSVNQKASETTFKMPAEDVKVLAKFALIADAYEGDTFGVAKGYLTTEGVDLLNDNGDQPFISVIAGGPQYAYVKNVYTDKLVFETTFKVKEIFNEDAFPKFGIVLNGTTEMVKFFVDMKPDMTCEGVGVVHQQTGGKDDWANAYSKGIDKIDLSKDEITLKVVRDGQDYYFYVNGVMVLCEKGAICNENTAVGIFSFNTGLDAHGYRHVEDGAAKAEIEQAKLDSYPLMGDFFGKSGKYLSSDVIDFSTDHGEAPYLVLDAGLSTPLYTYINDFASKQYYFEVDASVTDIRDDEKFPKFGIIARNDKEMVKFYLDMSREKLVSQVGVVRQPEGGKDDWNNQDVALLSKKLDLGKAKVEIGVLRNGTAYYIYVNDKLVYSGNDLSSREEAAGFFSFGTSLIINNYKLVEAGEDFDALLKKAKKDSKELYEFKLSQNFFDEIENGVYALTATSADEGKVDDVMRYAKVFRDDYYSISGKITLLNAKTWAQARIIISSDPKNEHVIALEKTGNGSYQIIAMSKDDEKAWDDWRLISSAGLNGDNHSIDFEVIVDGRKVYFLIDDEICYTSDRVNMVESTVKFAGYKSGTTRVENLTGKIFEDSQKLNEYLKTKDYAKFETERETRINELYKEYFVTNDCAGNGGTLLLGQSHLALWGDWEAQTGLTNYVNGYNIAMDLSTTDDWLYAYDKLVKPFKEGGLDNIVIALGENDATNWGKSGAEIVENLKKLFEKLHADFPNAEISYIYQIPSPANYEKGKFTNEKQADLAKAEKQLVASLDYVTGIDLFDKLVTANKKNSNKELFRDDKLHMNEKGYEILGNILYEKITKGETFGMVEGEGVTYKTTSGVELKNDNGSNPKVDIFGTAPRYAYLNDVYAQKFYFETKVKLEDLLQDDAPKYGLMVNGKTEMVKFYLDVNKDTKEVAQVGVVHQKAGEDDAWAEAIMQNMNPTLKLGTDEVTLGLLRNGKDYYFYVNGERVIAGTDLTAENGAAGVFSFNSVITLSDYKVVKAGTEYDGLLEDAKANVAELNSFGLTTNYFTKGADGVYTLTTDSADEGKVDDVKYAGKVVKEAYYSIEGKLTLNPNEDWAQARILISSDAKNEHIIAMERVDGTNYQIFAMSKANEEGWNDWRLISSAALNGADNSINFEVIVNGNKVYFLMDDKICYTSDRVTMAESTVKFAGYKNATITVENLDGQIFENAAAVESYLATKNEKPYETQFENRINELYKEYITDNGCGAKGGTVILGHSHMEAGFWTNWENQTGLTKYVNGFNVGIGGSTTKDWLYAYDKLVKSFEQADRFVISLSENDINVWGEDGEDAVERLKDLFQKIHTDFPDAEIYYLYSLISPTKYVNGAYTNAKYAELVQLEKALCEFLDYVKGIDTLDVLATADKKSAKTELFRDDQIHLNENGYEALSDYLYDEIFKGETFGVTKGDGVTYKTTNGVELINDKGTNAKVEMFGTSPRYAYVNDTYTKQFYFETEAELNSLLPDDWPKFGLIVNGATESVKFYLDVNKDNKQAANIGVVHQPTGQGDDWVGQKVQTLETPLDLSSGKVKLGLLRDGQDYYFYVNDKLVITGQDLTDENGAVGTFTFNTVVTLEKYKVVKAGAEYNTLLNKAKDDLNASLGFKLTTNHFNETQKDVFKLITNDGNEGNVDDLTYQGKVFKKPFYSVKGKLTLTDAGDWGQSRILISSDAKNEHMIALERTNQNKYQVFAVSKANEEGWNWDLRQWICDGTAKTYGNSFDFEVIADGQKVYFLINDVFCYASDRVSMAESTVKFSGVNAATTTVEHLDGTFFESSDEVQNYLATKSGENFGKTVSDSVTYQTLAGTDLSHDYGNNASIKFVGSGGLDAYLKDTYENKFYFETEINVESVHDGENYPKFGILLHGKDERMNFFVDMTKSTLTSNTVGIVRNYDWDNIITANVNGMNFTGNSKVKLAVIRDGANYFFYVNDQLVLHKINALSSENSAIGLFSFNTVLTAGNYQILKGDAADVKIAEARKAL